MQAQRTLQNSVIILAMLGASLLSFQAAVFADPPQTINIRGQLLDAQGHALSGTREYSVQFFDAASGGNALGAAMGGQTEVSLEGLFNITVSLPPEALSAPEVWYDLAISSGATPGPLASADAFPDRVKVQSVPFALEAAEVGHVDVSAVGSGAVLDTEFEALSGVTSGVQGQLDTKAAAADVYTKTEVDTAEGLQDDEIALKAYAADVYTKNEVDISQGLQDDEIAAKLPREGEAFVVVEVTGNAVTNGANLLAAYTAAAAKTPYSQALSTTNRVAVLLPPGQYDLGTGALLMDAEFVDVLGVSSERELQVILGTANGISTGVLMQTANDVRIENLYVRCAPTSGSLISDSTAPAAYFPDDNRPLTRIRNCVFSANESYAWPMRLSTEYSGTYEDCTAANRGFAGYGGRASGTFIRCIGGNNSFGAFGGTASGVFTDCVGLVSAFGGYDGTASGTFTNCSGGDRAFGGYFGTASGTFTDCTGGDYSFGGYGGTAGGTFTGCTARNDSFGGFGGMASGTFINCTGRNDAFGGNMSGSTGTFDGCRMEGTWDGTFRGRMEGCYWVTGFHCSGTTRIYNSTILGDIDMDNFPAGIAFSAIKGTILDAGNACFNHSNLEDTDVN